MEIGASRLRFVLLPVTSNGVVLFATSAYCMPPIVIVLAPSMNPEPTRPNTFSSFR